MKVAFNTILTTKDYSIFRYIKGNRTIDELNTKRLMASFKIKYDFTLLIVNELMQIIDGQHRLEAAKRLGLPVYYIIKKGLRLEDVIRYNCVQRIWLKNDYIDSFASAGKESYQWLKEFTTNYPEFGSGAAESILTNCYDGANGDIDGALLNASGVKSGKRKRLQQGELELTMADKIRGYDTAAKIMEYKPFFHKYNTGIFVKTVISLLKNPDFDNDKMVRQISKQPTKMVQCSNLKQYKLLMQDIYNFSSHSKKIALYP